MTDGIAMKGKRIIIPFSLQNQILEQLHINDMSIEKTRLLVRDSVYWVDMKTDILNTVRQCATYLGYKQMQPQE